MTNSQTASRILAVLILLLCVQTVAPGQKSPQQDSVKTDPQRDSKEAKRAADAELNEAARLYLQWNELFKQGRYAEALPLAQHMLELREKNLSADAPLIGQALNSLAATRQMMGDIEGIEPLYRRALEIYEKVGDFASIGVIQRNLKNLADLKSYPSPKDVMASPQEQKEILELIKKNEKLSLVGKFDKGNELLQAALTLREKTLSPNDVHVGVLLNELAGNYQRKGDYSKAEALYERALTIGEKSVGIESEFYATTLGNMAALYSVKGDYRRAESLLRRALALFEKKLGPEHMKVGYMLGFLGELRLTLEDYGEAESFCRRALAIFEKAEKTDRRDVDISAAHRTLAQIYVGKGDYARAEQEFEQSQKILKKQRKELVESPLFLGELYEFKGDYVEAGKLYKKALPRIEKWQGAQHPVVGRALCRVASFQAAMGNTAESFQLLTRGNENVEHNIALTLAVGSEEQKRLYLATVSRITDQTISFHMQSAPSDEAAARLALTTVLQRKGRALDAMVDSVAALRRRLNPEDRALLEQLSAASSQLAALTLNASQAGASAPEEGQENSEEAHQQQERLATIAQLETEVQRLQAAVSARSGEFRAQSQPVTLERVQSATPAGASLVELTLYRPYNPKARAIGERFGAARYAAYVLRREGAPLWVELGEAAEIDKQIVELRRALADPRRQDVKQLARSLDEVVMRPVRKLLGETRQIFLTPDGALNLVPFGALVDESGKYLVEDYTITYLTSGRDLLRLQLSTSSRQEPVIIANPRFDLGGDASAQTSQPSRDGQSAEQKSEQSTEQSGQDSVSRRSFDFTQVVFLPLPGTAGEAQALAKIVPGAKLLTEARATEAALKQLSAPIILHVATHGFFLPDQSRGGTRGLTLVGGQSTQAQAARLENPLLRSGLALSGANQRRSEGGEDGILTALEAAGLDLWGTKLVVLSACETGIGEVKNGEGVYGLRRALVLAGSESQVMSLWQVSDEATRELMVEYYKGLQAGKGRTEALRQVQLSMLGSGARGGERERRGLGLEQTEAARKSGAAQDLSHPFYWASFIQSGDWRSMSGQAPAK